MNFPDPVPLLACLLILTLVGGFGLLLAQRYGYFTPALVSFTLHLLAGGMLYVSAGLWAPDAMSYDRSGYTIARIWTENYAHAPTITAGKEGYPTVLAVLYATFGHIPALGVCLNIGLSTILVPVVALTAKRAELPDRTTAWLAATFPAFLLWGSLGLREASSWLLLAIVVLGLVSLSHVSEHHSPNELRDWSMIIAGVLGLLWIRGTLAVLVGGAVMLTAIPVSRRKLFPLFGGIAAIILAGPALMSQFSRVAGGYGVEEVNTVRSSLSRNATTAYDVQEYSSALGMVTSLPELLLRALFGPFPWEWPGVGPLFTIDALLWGGAMVLVIIGCRGRRWLRLLPFLLPALAIMVSLALTSGNYGTMQRLRIQAIIMVLPLVAAGWEHLRARRKQSLGSTRQHTPGRRRLQKNN